MKSVFKNIFACSVLMLASVAANATTGHWALSHEIAPAGLPFSHAVVPCVLTFDACENTYRNMTAKIASNDDDQADSSDSETMLA